MKRAFLTAKCFLFFLTILCATSHAKVSIPGDLTYERTAMPGETYEGSITISNNGDEPQEVKIYQTDYLFFSDGKNIYGEPGKDPRSNAGWITFGPKRTIIPAKDSLKVNYRIKVPEDGSCTGTYWSMLMVEGIGKGSPESSMSEKNKPRMGIQTVIRYGIQMVTHIGDTGTNLLKFQDTKLMRENDKVFLRVDIENVGERWLTPSLWVELYTGDGTFIDKFEGGKFKTYPGTSARCKVPLSVLARGRYKALVVADCGGENVFGGVYILKLEK